MHGMVATPAGDGRFLTSGLPSLALAEAPDLVDRATGAAGRPGVHQAPALAAVARVVEEHQRQSGQAFSRGPVPSAMARRTMAR